MDVTSLLLALAALLFLLLSAVFSAAGAAFDRASRPKLKGLAFGGNMLAEKAFALLERQERPQTVMMLGGRMALMLAVSLAAPLLLHIRGGAGFGWVMAGVSILLLLLGEAVPRALACVSPEKTAMRLAPALHILLALLAPLALADQIWHRVTGLARAPGEEQPLIEDELITMVDEAQSEGGMDAHEGELIRSAIEFTDQDARDILTPRVDVVGLDADCTMEEATQTFLEHGYSRLPVYRETMDDIIGILHEKDFYAGLRAGKTGVDAMMKPALYAPATLKISKLLKLLQSSKNHMAVILDEFGGTEGIVTLEDVLEELVGEIYDEHDDVLEAIRHEEDGSLLVDGGAGLKELLVQLHIGKEYEADTVGGWVAEEMGQIPKVGEGFQIEGITVQATRVWKRRVTQVRIVPPAPLLADTMPNES